MLTGVCTWSTCCLAGQSESAKAQVSELETQLKDLQSLYAKTDDDLQLAKCSNHRLQKLHTMWTRVCTWSMCCLTGQSESAEAQVMELETQLKDLQTLNAKLEDDLLAAERSNRLFRGASNGEPDSEAATATAQQGWFCAASPLTNHTL